MVFPTRALRIPGWGMALALALLLPRLATADEIFVLVDGIPGDAVEAGHVGWIRAFALGNSLALPHVPGSGTGGGRTERPTFSDLSILKGLDSASPALFVAAAGAHRFAKVDVDVVRPGAQRFVYFRIRLSDVLITGVRTNAGDERVTEFVTFAYERIRWEYTPQRPDGSAGPTVSGCWNVVANQSC